MSFLYTLHVYDLQISSFANDFAIKQNTGLVYFVVVTPFQFITLKRP